MSLVRLRANPRKVHVGIRRCGHGWLCTVCDSSRYSFFRCTDNDPAAAVDGALLAAKSWNLDGVDLDMQWTYRHPQSDRNGNDGVAEVLTC